MIPWKIHTICCAHTLTHTHTQSHTVTHTHTHSHTLTHTHQWQSVPFKMRKDNNNKIRSWAWPYSYYSILDDCHSYFIHPVQCNSDRFRLLCHTWIIPIISPTFEYKSFYWTNTGMFIPVLFCLLPFKKCFSTESAEWIHPWSRVNTVHIHSTFIKSKPNRYTQPTSLSLY
jgi:hypothetical protein